MFRPNYIYVKEWGLRAYRQIVYASIFYYECLMIAHYGGNMS